MRTGFERQQYTDCNTLTGSDFEQVYYLNQMATGVKFNNIYVRLSLLGSETKPLLFSNFCSQMTYGGTSWGFVSPLSSRSTVFT